MSLKKINDLDVYINYVPIVINDEILGSVIIFQDVTKIQKYEQRTRSYLNAKKHVYNKFEWGEQMKKVTLNYGKSNKELSIPEKNLYEILTPMDLEKVADDSGEVRNALNNPIGSVPLKEMAQGKKNVIILASDITRPSPSHILLPPIIEELVEVGVDYGSITIVFGLGYHRKHTEDEKKKLVGEEIYNKVKCLDHDIDDCLYLGTTKRGVPVEVFKPVAKKDLLIATGNLEFHYKAGYSGGYKALHPGVCSKRTIETNHKMMIQPGTMPGKADGNPMREDIEEAGQIAGVDFIVNAVLNNNKEIVKVVAGDPIKAHREGTKYIDKMYKRVIGEKADIVVASCGGYPKDINLYQAQKGLDNASFAVRDGGTIILLAECRDGLGEKTFEDWMLKAKSPHEPVEWIKKDFILGAHKAAFICAVLERAKVYLISSLDEDFTKEIFFTPASSAQAALDEALSQYGDKAKVLVLTNANSTVPYVE